MKKLIVFIGIMLFTGTIFAHPHCGLLGYFHQEPAYEFRSSICFAYNDQYQYTLTPQKLNVLLKETWVKNYIDTISYSFFSKGKFYMLSYDEDKNSLCYTDTINIKIKPLRIERNLYLFRLDDNGWTKASDKPVQTDWEETSMTNESYMFYYPRRIVGCETHDGYVSNGKVKISSDGTITIVLIDHQMNNEYKEKLPYFFARTVVLVPKDDGTYLVK